MDRLDEFEDMGQEVKEKINVELAPDFKSRSTLQTWQVLTPAAAINKWEGATLVTDSAHEIFINNTLSRTVTVTFADNYVLLDELTSDNSVTLQVNETAHFYATGIPLEGTLKLVMRTGSQGKRNTL
ncbi:MAG: hypothetical protein KAH32_07770 [Chlamydiia bacterium]|nr:hypothetical protein [Chlamydiia bacterium]